MHINVKKETVCACCFDEETHEVGFHIEMDHEREMPNYWTFNELEMVHAVMHKMRGDWAHSH